MTPFNLDELIVYDERAVIVRPGERFRVHCRDADTRDLIASGDPPPRVPHDIRAILHLARNGPRLLASAEESAEVITLIEALRRLPGVLVTGARAGDDTSRFASIARLDVLGPDNEELAILARVWNRVRSKGAIHVHRRFDAMAEVALFRAMVPRYSLDTSPTNRSSIQVCATGSRGNVVLTGDGHPDTLLRGLDKLDDLGTCRVFKAAHHGSHRNYRPRVFSKLKPERIWVSGRGEKHPSRDFLDFLCRQHKHAPFELQVTNTNLQVETMQRSGVLTIVDEMFSVVF